MAKPATKPATIGLPDLAVLLGVSRTSVYRAVARGEIRAVRLGRRITVPLREVDRLLGESPAPRAGDA